MLEIFKIKKCDLLIYEYSKSNSRLIKRLFNRVFIYLYQIIKYLYILEYLYQYLTKFVNEKLIKLQ